MGAVRLEAQRAPAFVYQLLGGGHSERGASGAGSREQPANDLPQLARARADGGRQDVVFDHVGKAGQGDPVAQGGGGMSWDCRHRDGFSSDRKNTRRGFACANKSDCDYTA